MRYAAGAPTSLDFDTMVHLVAIRYGTSPAAVRDWPADDFGRACAMFSWTGARNAG